MRGQASAAAQDGFEAAGRGVHAPDDDSATADSESTAVCVVTQTERSVYVMTRNRAGGVGGPWSDAGGAVPRAGRDGRNGLTGWLGAGRSRP
jgi:hypothetical protein